jgi:hypothetical protein
MNQSCILRYLTNGRLDTLTDVKYYEINVQIALLLLHGIL